MSAVILYARVSTTRQAERELSIAAQFRLMQRYAEERGLIVAARYQDVSSGRQLRGRPGLMAAIGHVKRDKSISGLVVHKIDRLSRNVFNHLILKGQLKEYGVKLFSVVESFEATPMGEFLENIMAAQAEFYSANLSAEVRKGLEERLLRGKWFGRPCLGYLMQNDRVVLDPARATRVREAFELWATGKLTASQLADTIYSSGLVGVHGKKVPVNQWCRLLKNPFYIGVMMSRGRSYPGSHPPLVSKELFDRCQEVFRQKAGGSVRGGRKHLVFVLAGKVRCPRCAATLTGERHIKKSGRIHDYYRCHQQGCSFCTRAADLDNEICANLLAMDLPATMVPVLRRAERQARRTRSKEQGERIRLLRQQRRELDEKLKDLARQYARGLVDDSQYDQERGAVLQQIRATEWFLVNRPENLLDDERGATMLEVVESMNAKLASDDPVTRRSVIEAVVAKVELSTGSPQITLAPGYDQSLRSEAGQFNVSPTTRAYIARSDHFDVHRS
ncbi:recombinase family protein [Patescibacteria group bacterium]|nr:MAG: recombinase family protein [Patescibacteria group bacterium]